MEDSSTYKSPTDCNQCGGPLAAPAWYMLNGKCICAKCKLKQPCEKCKEKDDKIEQLRGLIEKVLSKWYPHHSDKIGQTKHRCVCEECKLVFDLMKEMT